MNGGFKFLLFFMAIEIFVATKDTQIDHRLIYHLEFRLNLHPDILLHIVISEIYLEYSFMFFALKVLIFDFKKLSSFPSCGYIL